MISLEKLKITILIIFFISSYPLASEEFDGNTILATVNGKNITLGHVIAAVAKLPKEYDDLDSNFLLEGILDQIVKQELIAQTLNGSSDLTKASLENEIRSINARYAIEEKMKDFPTPQMIENAYEKTTLSMKNVEEFNASHILVDTEKTALDIIDLLNSGAEFSELARTKSTGPSSSNDGKLGWFGLGQMVPEFETAVIVLEVGRISQPVKTQFGWHIIKLNDRRLKPIPSKAELEPELIQKLNQGRVDQLIRDQTKASSIKYFDEIKDSNIIRDIKILK